MYCRKSTEAEDRQVASIESQITELTHLSEKLGVRVDEELSEARSAKAPGRPVFDALLKRVYRGEVKSIFCWKLDRLARNPVDGGSILWAMKQHGLEIVTPSQTFRQADDNKILLYIEFGMAEKYIDDLSRNVRRGLRNKCEKGWYPGVAPLGYLNDRTKGQGEREVVKDPERFPLVRRMWDLMLTGTYSPSRIVRTANTDWGFHTRPMKRQGGKPLARCMIYRILSDPFYHGWFEYPRGSGSWYRGSHPPMVTSEEFQRVQLLLGRRGHARALKYNFPFTGLVLCGECSGAVTAEEKHQLVCPDCRTKFAYRQKESCPKCETAIDDMDAPRFRHYTYYHCTKNKNPACRQRAVQAAILERQTADFLARISVSEGFKNWAQSYLQHLHAANAAAKQEIRESQQRASRECAERLENLLRLKTSPQNTDGSLLSDQEYLNQRQTLLKEKTRLEALVRDAGGQAEARLDRARQTFGFACRASTIFPKADPDTKKVILSATTSNLSLVDKMLDIKAKYPFRLLGDAPHSLRGLSAPIEPGSRRVSKRQREPRSSLRLTSCGGRDDLRTYDRPEARELVAKIYRFYQETDDVMELPVFDDSDALAA